MEKLFTKKYINHLDSLQRFPFKNKRMKELGSEVAGGSEDSQPTQPNPNPNHDRTGRPVVIENTSRSSAQEIDTRFSRDCQNTNLDEDADHDRTGRPVVIGQPIGSSSTFNEVDIDFRVSGVPHSVVKQADNSPVRNSSRRSRTILIDKIFKPIYNKIMPTTSCSDGNWRSHIRESFCVTSASSKDFLET